MFQLSANAKFTAHKKTELGGRKNLALADFKQGSLVKASFKASDGLVFELRLEYK